MAKLSDKLKSDIGTLLDNGHTLKGTAKKLGIHISTVYRVHRHRVCGHINAELARTEILETGDPMAICARFSIHPKTLNSIIRARLGVTIREILNERKTTYRKRQTDPRSATCQQITYCSHTRCHLHARCPSYHAYVERYQKGATS